MHLLPGPCHGAWPDRRGLPHSEGLKAGLRDALRIDGGVLTSSKAGGTSFETSFVLGRSGLGVSGGKFAVTN